MIIIYVLFSLFIYNRNSFNQFLDIKFYNVGQGDSSLIILPKGNGYILVDCYNDIDEYLKRDGIRKLDIIFISHGHSDHVGSLENLDSDFKIGRIYTSYYDDTEILKELKKEYDIELLKSGDVISLADSSFMILGPINKYDNENDNSLVFQMKYKDFTALFTGDIEEDAEADLVNKYGNKLSSDVLKVSHHGSKSSSSLEFITRVNPKIFVIHVGNNNSYGLPNNKYLLSCNNLYRTDLDGTIEIKYRKKLKIKTFFS